MIQPAIRVIRSMTAALDRFTAHRDPCMAYGNLVAVLVGSNQPFFPLTLLWVMGEAARPSLWGMLSTVAFCAVPLIARRHVLLAKILFCLYASLHTGAYVVLMGQALGFELFLIPCILLAALLFGPRQRILAWLLCAVPVMIFLALQHSGQARLGLPEAMVGTLWQINAISVACLVALMGMLAPQARDEYP
jgi:hypothetical protein